MTAVLLILAFELDAQSGAPVPAWSFGALGVIADLALLAAAVTIQRHRDFARQREMR